MKIKYEAEIKDCTECDFAIYYDGWHCMLQKEGKEYPEDLPMNLRPCPIAIPDIATFEEGCTCGNLEYFSFGSTLWCKKCFKEIASATFFSKEFKVVEGSLTDICTIGVRNVEQNKKTQQKIKDMGDLLK